jgi:hypothetical protein
VPADQFQGGVEDAVADGRRGRKAELVEQVLVAAEQPVQGGAGDAGLGGQLVHGQPGQALPALVVAGLRGGGEGRQDLLLGDGWRGHGIILDKMYRLV